MKKIASFAFFLILCFCGLSLAEEVIKDGVKKEYYPSGKIKKEITLKNGKLDGFERHYREDGKMYFEALYSGGIYQSHNSYFENGQLG